MLPKGQCTETNQLCDDITAVLEKAIQENRLVWGDFVDRIVLAQTCVGLGKADASKAQEAREYLNQAKRQNPNPNPWETSLIDLVESEIDECTGDLPAAIKSIRMAWEREAVKEAFGFRGCEERLVDLLRRSGQFAEAESVLRKGLKKRLDQFGEDNIMTAYVRRRVGRSAAGLEKAGRCRATGHAGMDAAGQRGHRTGHEETIRAPATGARRVKTPTSSNRPTSGAGNSSPLQPTRSATNNNTASAIPGTRSSTAARDSRWTPSSAGPRERISWSGKSRPQEHTILLRPIDVDLGGPRSSACSTDVDVHRTCSVTVHGVLRRIRPAIRRRSRTETQRHRERSKGEGGSTTPRCALCPANPVCGRLRDGVLESSQGAERSCKWLNRRKAPAGTAVKDYSAMFLVIIVSSQLHHV